MIYFKMIWHLISITINMLQVSKVILILLRNLFWKLWVFWFNMLLPVLTSKRMSDSLYDNHKTTPASYMLYNLKKTFFVTSCYLLILQYKTLFISLISFHDVFSVTFFFSNIYLIFFIWFPKRYIWKIIKIKGNHSAAYSTYE